MLRAVVLFAAAGGGCGIFGVQAGETTELAPVIVVAPAGLAGAAAAASQGFVPRETLQAQPIYRPGELLERVPGLVVTQHSGEGKANQYFMRGFNLDHGTDFGIRVDGVPVNLRTHGHGQGYADLNFLIPELVAEVQYRKGPYYAEAGDFSAAGAARILLARRLERDLAEVGFGTDGYRRALVAASPELGAGHLLYALEVFGNDGPWTHPDDARRINATLRFAQGTSENGFDLTALAYRGRWRSTDQIPKRAIETGELGRFDTVDPTDGGRAQRYALSAAWRRTHASGSTAASAYLVHSDLQLFSNFTYFLRDPVNGDQFEQMDRRVLSGLDLQHAWKARIADRDFEQTIGAEVRHDNIALGLFDTRGRVRTGTTRQDRVVESSAAFYLQSSVQLGEKLRAVAGARSDHFQARVSSDNAMNSGKATDSIVSPKLSLALGPWAKTEYYLNWGHGFHSNDARGATIRVDPSTGAPAARVPLLVRARGYEAGLRSVLIPRLQSTLSIFRLDLDAELIFAGDAGTTEAGRASRRVGIELSSAYAPTSWLLLDADIAYTRARLRPDAPEGSRVPGAPEAVASFFATVDRHGPYYGSLRLRFLGPRPLTEDNRVRSGSSTQLSARIGYRVDERLRVQLDAFNLLNRRASQISYFYESRLRGEASDVADVHFHPLEPRSFRAALIAEL